jgi:hypothetical protein
VCLSGTLWHVGAGKGHFDKVIEQFAFLGGALTQVSVDHTIIATVAAVALEEAAIVVVSQKGLTVSA